MAVNLGNWKSLVDKAVKTARDREFLKEHWRCYDETGIEILRTIYNQQDIQRVLITKESKLMQRFQEDNKFLHECLITALGEHVRSLSDKFKDLLIFVENKLDFNNHDWQELFKALFIFAVENDRQQVLYDLLAVAYDDIQANIRNDIAHNAVAKLNNGLPRPVNDQALIKACEKNNYHLVKALVQRGYRLKTGQLTKKSEEELSSWKRYAEVPFVSNKASTFNDDKDDISDLNILRCMAKPAYITACYSVTAERIDWDESEKNHCECGLTPASTVNVVPGEVLESMQKKVLGNDVKASKEKQFIDKTSYQKITGLIDVMEYQIR